MDALRSSLIALVVVLGGCDVGEVPPAGGLGPDGGTATDGATVTEGSEAVFNSTIKPLVMTKGCVPCHSAGQAPNFSSYQTLDPKYRRGPVGTNLLLNEAGDGVLHNGVTYFTTAEKTTISNWIQGK
jgi:hypothetical protein